MGTEQPKLAEEIKKMEVEEFLPIEKKLVCWSIGLGIVLSGHSGVCELVVKHRSLSVNTGDAIRICG